MSPGERSGRHDLGLGFGRPEPPIVDSPLAASLTAALTAAVASSGVAVWSQIQARRAERQRALEAVETDRLELDRRLLRYELALMRSLLPRSTGTSITRLLAVLVPPSAVGHATVTDPKGVVVATRGTAAPTGRGRVQTFRSADGWTVATSNLGSEAVPLATAGDILKRVLSHTELGGPSPTRLAEVQVQLQTAVQSDESLPTTLATYLKTLSGGLRVDAAALFIRSGANDRQLACSVASSGPRTAAFQLVSEPEENGDLRKMVVPIGGPGSAARLVLAASQAIQLAAAEYSLLNWATDHLAFVLKRTADGLSLQRSASEDALTGLLNRGRFDRELTLALDESARDQTEVSLAIFDIDHFKSVNDTYGHVAGDVAIRHVADVLRGVVQTQRAEDRFVLARYGGEELVLLMPGMPEVGAARIADLLRRRVEQSPVDWDGQSISLTVSGGRTTHDGSCPIRPADFIGQADAALYEAKRGGRNRVRAASCRQAASAAGSDGTLVRA